MKASELRIGNLLNFSNGIQPDKEIVVGRRFFSSAAIEKEDGDFEITPYYRAIQLTDEWLLKLDFKKARTFDDNTRYIIGVNPVTKDWMMYLTWLDNYEFPFYTNGHHKIKYVHQLQNLYYALTGEELNIVSLIGEEKKENEKAD